MRKTFILMVGVLLLVVINYSIYAKEELLKNGQVVLLELAPVDPRSLMQGDYMALRFAIANKIREANQGKDVQQGHVVIALNENNVGEFKRLDDGRSLAKNEVKMWYRYRNQRVQFATNAYFFQEGDAKIYEASEYGEFRVDRSGESILTNMIDKNFKTIGFKLKSGSNHS